MATNTKNQDMLCANCGQPNRCALASDKTLDECWCNTTRFTKAALNNMPEQEKLKRCLCPACATAIGEPALAR